MRGFTVRTSSGPGMTQIVKSTRRPLGRVYRHPGTDRCQRARLSPIRRAHRKLKAGDFGPPGLEHQFQRIGGARIDGVRKPAQGETPLSLVDPVLLVANLAAGLTKRAGVAGRRPLTVPGNDRHGACQNKGRRQ